jgi:hypothetical protein
LLHILQLPVIELVKIDDTARKPTLENEYLEHILRPFFNMSRPLEPYFREINRHGRYFAKSTSYKSPQLQPGKVNRILIYSGCFNPPHIGHASLLQHVFSNSGEDLNIIAAIVMPKDDDAIERKLKESDSQLKLTKSERVKLWLGHEPSDYLWVFAVSEDYWEPFRDKLIENTKRDGFEVKLCSLCGPDHVERLGDSSFRSYPWGCDELFSSDISRDSTIMQPGHTAPKQLRRHSPWEGAANVWTCHPTDDRLFYTLRFVPKPEDNRVPRTSSTAIRDSLQNVRKLRSGELRGYARDLVLRPDLLAGMLFKSSP